MAESRQFQKLHYPLPAYNFRVTIDDTAMNFTEVSGIELEHQKLTYRHGMSFWEGEHIRTFHYNKYVPVTLKRGTFKGSNFLYEWLNQEKKTARSMDVSLCDEQGQPVVTWRIAKALPVKLESPVFDVDSNNVSIESLELMAAGITVIHH